ncbi:MAG: hypothetical protein ABI231_08360 [Candidatus Tumulicola sp.]
MIAERVVVDHYRHLIRYFGKKKPTPTHMFKRILAVEEDHASVTRVAR